MRQRDNLALKWKKCYQERWNEYQKHRYVKLKIPF